MGYKYLKRGIRIGFSFTLGMMLLLSGCSGGMEEMQTSQIPEDMGSATEEDVNLVELDSSIVELEEGLLAVRYDGDYGFDGFIAQGGASSDGEVIAYLADNLLVGLNLGDLLDGVFGCSTIAVQSPEGDALFGRNFDWNTCEAMVVEAHPDNGYASLSTVNMDFITQNVGGGMVGMALSLDEVRTLAALYAPLDGMNEAGLAVSVNMIQDSAAIEQNTDKPDVTTTTAIRLLYNFAQPLIRYRISDHLTLKTPMKGSPFTRAEILLGRNEDLLWFESGDGHRDFLHPLAVEGFCIEGLRDYQFRQTAPDAFEMLAETAPDAQISEIKTEMLRQMKSILQEKHLSYVQFYMRFVDAILPDPATGKKPLIVPSEKTETGDAV